MFYVRLIRNLPDSVRRVLIAYPEYPRYPFHRTFATLVGYGVSRKMARAGYDVATTSGDLRCRTIMIASGACNVPSVPALGKAVPPSALATDDPYRTADYPGFVSVVGCGRHDPEGRPWREALARELRYFERQESLPEIGSPPGEED